MRKLILMSFLFVFCVLLVAGSALAVKPDKKVDRSNGFPSGPHYNLNIIGKKWTFQCPEPQNYWRVIQDNNGDEDEGELVKACDSEDDCEATNEPIYGNVIFIPEDGQDIKIYMQSGKGKKAAAIPDLQVIDPCATDGTEAVMQLPRNDAGYRVYARALAKPTGTRKIATTPELVMVEDENGNPLVFLGTLSANGFETPDGYIYRRKGKSRALDITRLFEWSGLVCSIGEPFEDGLAPTLYCGGDPDDNGTIDFIPLPETGICPADYPVLYELYCKEYPETWVFNIGAFVEYMWNMDNNGVKLLQVRFYPN